MYTHPPLPENWQRINENELIVVLQNFDEELVINKQIEKYNLSFKCC